VAISKEITMAGPVKLNIIRGYEFTCYPLSQASFINIAAVYVIIGVAQSGSWTVLDVGQSGELGERIEGHPREGCWRQNWPNGNIWVCVYPTPGSSFTKEQRAKIEGLLREQLKPLCEER
jgi:hypothetical protein